MKRRTRVLLCLGVVAAMTAGLSGPSLAAGPDDTTAAGGRPGARSTGTVVVARTGSAPIVTNVGTSTITVRAGARVSAVKGQLVASDRSRQRLAVVDGDGREKRAERIEAGDRLRVTAEDGHSVGSYTFAIDDPDAARRDGVYWNHARYDEIDRTVNANTPVFPDRRCDITDHRYAYLVRQITERYAVGNEAGDPAVKSSPLVYASHQVWYYADAIAAAIADCHRAGGGIVVVPAGGSRNPDGAYYSGAITLLSRINLHIETGAVVKFVRNKTNEFYPVVLTSYEGSDLYSFSPFVYALHQTNIAVTGGGLLDGQEDMWNWRPWKKGYWGEPSVENKDTDAPYGTNGVLNAMNYADVPIQKRIFSDDGHLPATIPVIDGDTVRNVAPPADAVPLRSTFRPSLIQTYASSNVLIEDVKIRNTPFWIVHPVSSKNVLIRNLDIYSDKTKDFEAGGWNNDDGVDPESSSHVVMEGNHVTVSDDGAAIKAGRNVNGREHRNPSEDIIIRHSVYNNDGGGSAAVSMGSEMSGGVRNVFIHDNEFGGPGLSLALKIKTNSNRGGYVENIYLRDCLLRSGISGMVQFDGNYSETVPFPGADVFNPTIRNIYLDNVDTAPTMTPGRTTFQMSSAASRSPVENVYYRNSDFYTTNTLDAGFRTNKNIKNFVVENVSYINPSTLQRTIYNTTPLNLLDETEAVTDSGQTVRLIAASSAAPDTITAVPARTFTLRGRVDLTAHPDFVAGGTVRVFVDRSGTPIPAALAADGSFTTGPITLDDDQSWYQDRHYVAVNFYNGINMNTAVYQVAVAPAD
ncbi:glycosyl hydrolase family 28 protein [Micromonospora sp. NPDC005367]|uniref:glycoside hydrolase family 28 protein n=1 Tax=Micromonospora sp. NPDC005367 TaxID=3155590 RepID=UPI0033ACCAD7